ncbi:WD40-repeat-containing domain protein [Pelagophyceae sp. CCMP2097]|nr:WD40-repeat-containing domain protein [Pelagophyceae sp. CCMP2097]
MAAPWRRDCGKSSDRTASQRGTAILKHTAKVNCCAFSPDGKRALTASVDGTARLSPDGKRVVTVSRDETAQLWDAATGAPLATLEGHTSWVYSCAFSPGGKRIVTASMDSMARLWDAETGALLVTFEGHDGSVYSCADDDTAKLWDAETGAVLATLEGHTDVVRSCAFSPDGKRIATASENATARLWSIPLS